MDKYEVIRKHNPKFQDVDFESVLSVGNGDFAFNCDITGFQTLFDEYLAYNNPLTTMSNQGWGSYHLPDDIEVQNVDNPYLEILEHHLVQDQYQRINGYKMYVPAHEHPQHHWIDARTGEIKGQNILRTEAQKVKNSKLYNWLRQNPHRKNLGILQLEVNGRIPQSEDISNISTRLDLLTSTVHAKYEVDGYDFEVVTCCYQDQDTVLFKIKSYAFADCVARLKFSQSTSSHTIAGADFSAPQVNYYDFTTTSFDFELLFSSEPKLFVHNWNNFWEQVKIIKLDDGTDQMLELERREILSIYNLAVHSSGSIPPQETGLMCNSWYGKFHLEMHLWHAAWAPLYNVPQLLERSLNWYLKMLPLAKYYAERNGFTGCRWPKMVGPQGVDSPSFIAPLLVWQQSHIIFLLHLLYGADLPEKYAELVIETARYMFDFLVRSDDGQYDMIGPVIPAQEEFDPLSVRNPTFEMAYQKYCLKIVAHWFDNLHFGLTSIHELCDSIRIPNPINSYYQSHANAPDTFPNYMKDHPMQLAIVGLFENADADREALNKTLLRTLDDWDEQSMWGWDYGYMAMLASELGDATLARNILQRQCPKNYYAINGHNYQKGRTDLPCYLPGNGALLWAIYKIWGQE